MRNRSQATDRQILEKEHYDLFYRHNETFFSGRVDFHAAQSPESRPYNPYWRVFSLVKDSGASGKRVLDCGCGTGYYSVLLASLGAMVYGVDISQSGVELARKRAEALGYGESTFYYVSTLEDLPFGNERFDYIFGIDILHHVDIRKAIPQLRRTLKSGGKAIFKEWKTAFLFDRVRNSSLGLRVFPKKPDTSEIVDLTETERKLTGEDLAFIRSCFKESTLFYSYFFMHLRRLFRGEKTTERLLKLDYFLALHTSFMARMGGEVILLLEK